MISVTYLLTALLTQWSFLAGIWLAYNSPEEMKPGKKYFTVAAKILWLILLLAVLIFVQGTVLKIIFAAFFSAQFMTKSQLSTLWFVVVSPFIIFFSDYSTALITALVVYALVLGTLNKKALREIATSHVVWILIPILLSWFV
ncbi:MAG: hypothetical protein ACI8Y7_000893 [Candidatus Woesearchaeota archaeon]|jgi:hypothetical protein